MRLFSQFKKYKHYLPEKKVVKENAKRAFKLKKEKIDFKQLLKNNLIPVIILGLSLYLLCIPELYWYHYVVISSASIVLLIESVCGFSDYRKRYKRLEDFFSSKHFLINLLIDRYDDMVNQIEPTNTRYGPMPDFVDIIQYIVGFDLRYTLITSISFNSNDLSRYIYEGIKNKEKLDEVISGILEAIRMFPEEKTWDKLKPREGITELSRKLTL